MKTFLAVCCVLTLAGAPLILAEAAEDTPPPAASTVTQQQLTQDQQRLIQAQRKLEQDEQQLYRRALSQNQQQLDVQMREARRQMQVAAQRMAQLALQMNGPMISRLSHLFNPNRAVLGVTVQNVTGGEEAGGVKVLAVTPGGPAEQAGIRAGDVITAINDKSLTTNPREPMSDRVMDVMGNVNPGDTLSVSYLRNGRVHRTTLKAGRMADYGSIWNAFPAPAVQPANMRAVYPPWPFFGRGGPWAGMQLVSLSPGLGQYFGTQHGLLVLRAPRDTALKLEDGDVFLKIGHYVPTTPSEAMRIIYSYAPGKAVTLHILRKGKPLTLDIRVPARSAAIPGPYQPMEPNN